MNARLKISRVFLLATATAVLVPCRGGDEIVPPVLEIEHSETGRVKLCWSVGKVPFQLQEAGLADGVWTNGLIVPALVEQSWCAELNATPPGRMFRLVWDPPAVTMVLRTNVTIAAEDPAFRGVNLVIDGAEVIGKGCLNFASLELRNGAVLTHAAGDTDGLCVNVVGDALIESGSRIDVSGRGHASGMGEGTPSAAVRFNSGAGYGGLGGRGKGTSVVGQSYGSITQPSDLGSGGGQQDGSAYGGAGGGALRLTVGGVLSVEGVLAADGESPAFGGAGSGGSLWIECTELSGAGSVTANGGNGTNGGGVWNGGGGGGRIALYCDNNQHTGALTAFGGDGYGFGSAGTVYTKLTGSQKGLLLIQNRDHGSQPGSATEFSGDVELDMHVEIGPFGWVSHPEGEPLHLSVLGDLVLRENARIDVSGRGYHAGEGPGTPPRPVPFENVERVSGAGYGGAGGFGLSAYPRGLVGGVYGSEETPEDLGSGAASTLYYVIGGDGGSGGGALHLSVEGRLLVDGLIAAEGTARGAAGGSGGSLWIECATLSGAGTISADGGDAGVLSLYGGGGGGRIAIYTSCASSALHIHSRGGSGWTYPQTGISPGTGQGGTVFYQPGEELAVSVEGAGVVIPPPASVALNGLVNDEQMMLFGEQSAKRLDEPLPVNIAESGVFTTAEDLIAGVVPAGTVVASYYVHMDTSSISENDPVIGLSATVSFTSEILGIIVQSETLDQTDEALARDETAYPPTGQYWRGLELGGAGDAAEVVLSEDRRTLTINARVAEWADQMRIIVASFRGCE